ncbi:MAG TPA: alpha/beta hydrolase [Actinomycetota bacterium]|nr:alpha/beta hydrolase [Actinomycetota bacterium]
MRASLRRTGYVVVVLTGLALLPPVQARAKALAVVVEAIGLPFTPRPFAAPVTRSETTLGGVRGDVYDPGGDAPAILLVHGAALQGKDDPRLVRLAQAVSRARRLVFVPALTLAERRFDAGDIERIVRSGAALAERVGAPISVLGISYGGSFALIAAADERLEDRLEQVAVFGAYYDLRGVIQAVTAGEALVAGERIPWRGDPQAIEILERHAVQLAPEEAQARLSAALDGAGDSSALPPDARAVYELLSNRDPTRTYELASRLSPTAREILERFSPSSVADRIRVPIVAIHSKDDPAVPYGEALRLVRALPDTPLETLGSFRHVDFELGSPRTWGRAAGDLWSTLRFTTWLLEPAE